MTKPAPTRGATADKVLAVFKPGEWFAPRAIAKAVGIDSAAYFLGKLVAEAKLVKRGTTSDRQYALPGTTGGASETTAPKRETKPPKRGTKRRKAETNPSHKKRENGATAQAAASAANGHLPEFIAALTHEKGLVVIGANHTHLFNAEETLHIADVILANFEPA